MKMYGIKNCNSVQKAIQALNNKGFVFDFLDIKKLDEDTLNSWLEKRKVQDFINSGGMTARKLGLNKKKIEGLDENELKNLVLNNPSLIKRPVIFFEDVIFISKEYENFLYN
ncbi:ArsC family transcriptional regulator [Campylobacter sp. MIT 21-1685]|uniref:arsenate reductase family protein n=1 Tax=unclassified Campylobacter TaxID=2593542 RepID=UPI00224A92AF|nr:MULTISPECIES: ArsC/Spx/MgsR family protein [unclassified Campylobacter]MCX2682787.1 ArsC family transcriptional regulator [Campylobacter sp. MIT 21-1684]MCX2751067.1 ArsC family transcriptional regulator [Campylobacter sp. MIT 21-1682]MCX2807268.1 ArsC family transcriptional regulator [Campylobacter sp. MIT 21-1685]